MNCIHDKMAKPNELICLCDKSSLCVMFTCAPPIPKPYKAEASTI